MFRLTSERVKNGMIKYPDKVDFHMHTTVSDGTDTPEEMPERVRQAGIGMFSVTDHDAIKGCKAIQDALTENDPVFVTGIEFSCMDEKGRYHILGYGYDPDSSPIQSAVEKGHGYRINKLRARLDYLRTQFGFTFEREDIDRLFALDNPGKPHIANLMVKYGFADTKENAIMQFINGIRFKSQYIRPEEAIAGILASGGIPVLAHPCFGSGDQLIPGDELESRVKRLMQFGLKGVEGFYSGFSKEMRDTVISIAGRYGLYITAGSDYHGSNKTVIPGDTGLDSFGDCPEGILRFMEDCTKRL